MFQKVTIFLNGISATVDPKAKILKEEKEKGHLKSSEGFNWL